GEVFIALAAHAQGDAVAEAAPVPGLPGGGIAVVAVQPACAYPAHAQGVVGQARREQRAAAVVGGGGEVAAVAERIAHHHSHVAAPGRHAQVLQVDRAGGDFAAADEGAVGVHLDHAGGVDHV